MRSLPGLRTAALLGLCLLLPHAARAQTLHAGDMVPVSTDNVEIEASAPLKKAGAAKLSVFFETTGEASDSNSAWLIGSTAGKILWIKKLPVTIAVNRAKTDVVCRGGKIVVLSQYSGSASYDSQTFSWDGQKAVSLGTKSGDPSQAIVDTLKRLAAKGSRAQLNHFEEEDHSCAYPQNYITQENLLALLQGGQKAAQALAEAGQPALAAARMELAFDASMAMVALGGEDCDQTKIPAKWLAAWQADSMQLPAEKWTPFLSDYAQYLQKSGKHKQASEVLAALSSKDVTGTKKTKAQ